MLTPEQLSRLPKAAQRHIEDLQRKLRDAEEANRILSGEVGFTQEGSMRRWKINPAKIRHFQIGAFDISADEAGRSLVVRADEHLALVPRANNAVGLVLHDKLAWLR